MGDVDSMGKFSGSLVGVVDCLCDIGCGGGALGEIGRIWVVSV